MKTFVKSFIKNSQNKFRKIFKLLRLLLACFGRSFAKFHLLIKKSQNCSILKFRLVVTKLYFLITRKKNKKNCSTQNS